MENILDQTQAEKCEFVDCKIKYLLAENRLINVQLAAVGNLVNKYKGVVDLLATPQTTSQSQEEKDIENGNEGKENVGDGEGQIRTMLREAEHVIENCITECKSLCSPTSIFPEEESTITPAFFSELVMSYEQTIASLKQSIHQREILLQDLETNPSHPMKRGQELPENTNVIKAIESYDIYPRISERCKQEILTLKAKKRDLQSRTKENLSNEKKIQGHFYQDIDKTVKKISTESPSCNKEEEKTQIKVDSMSPFEKTVLIYKKKRIFNDILESKVLELKKKIQEKEQCNRALRCRLENEVWENIYNMQGLPKDLDEDDPAYLSMLNQSLRANNLDFSVDISTVLGGGIPNNTHNGHNGGNNAVLDNILEDEEITQRD